MAQRTSFGREPQELAGAAPEEVYHARAAHFAQQRARFDQRWSRVANIRLVLFLVGVLVAGLAVWQGSSVLAVIAGVCVIGFVVAIAYHTRLGEIRASYATLWEINDEGLRRLRRNWATLPLREAAHPPADSTYARDLDVFGHASLSHLLGTPTTPTGLATLQAWLLQPAPPAVVRMRQGAVAELARAIGFRDDLALAGRGLGESQTTYELFLHWAEAAPWLRRRSWLVWASRLLPLLLLGTLVAQMTGLTRYPFWLVIVLVNYGLTATIGKRVTETIDQVAERQGVFRTYALLFGLIAAEPFAAPALHQLQARLTNGDLRADQELRRLGRIMAFADLRAWLLFIIVQLLTLWTFHVLFALEGWQRRAGPQTRSWLVALGEIEALAAFGTLAHDHPAWSYPTLVEGERPLLIARELAHPLLAPGIAVANDVEIGPPGTLLLVTGSNMSGKSTLLRAIGLNVVLAQAGGPVCAAELRVPPLVLATSMRVEDSLERGVSYFMAELQRLKTVVDLAQAVQAEGTRTLLYLLDEILHGTNTTERQIAARHILRYLLAMEAIGAVSTHDLTLADVDDLAHASRAVHFAESFTRGPDGPAMHFDYTLRPGIATSTNALALMELVGLPIPEEQLPPGR